MQHLIAVLVGAVLVALGASVDGLRRPRTLGRHRHGIAPGTGAQWLTTHPAAAAAGGAETHAFSRGRTYRSGLPLHPEG
jgi:hypothetical protein